MTAGPTTLVVRNGTVLDGTGADPVRADVAIADGRIERIGEIEPGPNELDARGAYVAPGFIDIHSHSDYTLLVDPRAVSAVHQGVTLEVVGNCGHGCFPIRDEGRAARAIYGHSDAVPVTWRDAAGYFEVRGPTLLDRSLWEASGHWETFRENMFIAESRDERILAVKPMNCPGHVLIVLSLVPNGQLRLAVVGLEDRPATAEELREMTSLLEEGLEQGAWGYSTGLEYAQERGAPEAELTALCRASARRGGIYATHTRRRDAGAASAVEEAVRTARAADGRLQLSHLVPRSGEEEGRRCIAVIDDAAESGLDVAFDMHTRLYGTTFLQAALPPALLNEPPARLAELLRDRATIDVIESYESILSAGGDWDRIVLLDNPIVPEYGRRSIAAIAAERGQKPLEAVSDLLLAAIPDTARLMVINHCHTEAQQRETFAHPLCMPGSDATTAFTPTNLARLSSHPDTEADQDGRGSGLHRFCAPAIGCRAEDIPVGRYECGQDGQIADTETSHGDADGTGDGGSATRPQTVRTTTAKSAPGIIVNTAATTTATTGSIGCRGR